MKILYYSTLAFTDCDFPLIREYQKQGVDCKYVISLLSTKLFGSLFKIEKQISKSRIIKGKDYKEFAPYIDYFNTDNLYIVNRTKKGIHPLNILLYFKMILFIIRYNPDVIHITHPLWGPELLLYLFASKMVLTVHDPFVHSGEGNRAEHCARKLAFKLCKKLVLLNDKQREQFEDIYSIDSKKIFVNRLGIYDCLNVSSSTSNTTIHEKYILFFGRISPYKGIDDLCKAMQFVNTKHPDVSCVIAGGGKMYFDYSPFEGNKSIKLINRYIPTVELVGLIKGSLFTVCPYKDATQSGVIYSSFALYKPVVASNVGALSDAVKNNITGVLVQPSNPKALADAIIRMIENPDFCKSMESNIKEIYEKGENSWYSIANKYKLIYNA